MAFRFHRFRGASRVFRYFHTGSVSRRKLPNTSTTSWPHLWKERDGIVEIKRAVRGCSTLSASQHDSVGHTELLNCIKSTFNVLEGPNHHWLNYHDQSGPSFNQDGIYLVVVNTFLSGTTLLGHHERIIMLERVKLLQQRYQKLNVFGLQCSDRARAMATQVETVKTIMEDYITFPILIFEKNLTRMTNRAHYLLFEGLTNRLLYHDLGTELEDIVKVIEEFDVLRRENAVILQNSNEDKLKQHEVNREPHLCSSFRNLLLCYPGCVSVDEDGNRLFISDSNHHQIIITDGDGKILDCIGSSPGSEDGEFESAKLLRPAASFYNDAENSLYFVDSENNAIRRADMEKRMVETVYPVTVSKTGGIWSWILDKLGLEKEVDAKPEEFSFNSCTFPWHLLMLPENDLLIINRSFEMSWTLSMTTWEIKVVTRGSRNILENYGHIIEEKLNFLRNISGSWSTYLLNNCLSLEEIPYVGLMSSFANFQSYTIFCDAAGHRVLKYHRESRSASTLQFSDLGILGLPYWLPTPVEKVFSSGHLCKPWKEHLHYFTVLPGRCHIRVNVNIPKGTALAAPLEEDSIWRQARGSAAELSASAEAETCREKVGVAQQWFDELDNLAFSESSMESRPQVEEKFLDGSFQDTDKVRFDCPTNISPGTGEVIISAVLHLKLSRAAHEEEDRRLQVRRILDLQNQGNGGLDDACTSLLLETCSDFKDLVFMKPLHIRIRLECSDHPPATTNKETISTDTALEINVSLD